MVGQNLTKAKLKIPNPAFRGNQQFREDLLSPELHNYPEGIPTRNEMGNFYGPEWDNHPLTANNPLKGRSPLQEALRKVPANIEVPNNPTYFSNIHEAFSNPKIPNKLSKDQAMAVLSQPGVKKEELKWMGIEDYLKSKPKHTKADIQKWIEDHTVDVEEIPSRVDADELARQFPSAAEWAKANGYEPAKSLGSVDDPVWYKNGKPVHHIDIFQQSQSQPATQKNKD